MEQFWQLTEQGEEHPILYLSKKFSEVEKRYCTTEKECTSIVFAIKRLHYYLDGNSFLVMTDHNPLVWLNRNVSSNPRLMRWALALATYNFRIVHRSVVLDEGMSVICQLSHRHPIKLFSTEKFHKKRASCNVTSRKQQQHLGVGFFVEFDAHVQLRCSANLFDPPRNQRPDRKMRREML
ncbi:transposon Tf2-9 polyprotein [Trichonephila clavipes]|nr:transposon Tf2-9 polyprotein [Trichonephila clavipes]